MGLIAAQAEEHYREFLPIAYASIPEGKRAAFFQQIEDAAAEEIASLADSLEGPDPMDESFVDKRARLTVAQATATSQVMREMVLVPPETVPESARSMEDVELTQALRDFAEARDSLLDR